MLIPALIWTILKNNKFKICYLIISILFFKYGFEQEPTFRVDQEIEYVGLKTPQDSIPQNYLLDSTCDYEDLSVMGVFVYHKVKEGDILLHSSDHIFKGHILSEVKTNDLKVILFTLGTLLSIIIIAMSCMYNDSEVSWEFKKCLTDAYYYLVKNEVKEDKNYFYLSDRILIVDNNTRSNKSDYPSTLERKIRMYVENKNILPKRSV